MRAPAPFALAALAVAAGLVGGTGLDERGGRAPERRGGWLVLEADFHVHTRFSDGFLSPLDVVVHARRRGLHAIAVTEHNLIFPARMARWFARWTGGPAVVIGEEVTSARQHVIALGLRERIDGSLALDRVVADVHRQGGLVVAAHPVEHFWPAFAPVRPRLDAAEVMHPLAWGGGRDARWRWTGMRDFYLAARRENPALAPIGSSDYHFGSPLGVCRTLVFARAPTADAVLDAVRAGRTVVYDREGRAYGPDALVAALASAPYRVAPHDYNYRGDGPLDRALRTLAWLGLVGLLVLRPRASTPLPPSSRRRLREEGGSGVEATTAPSPETPGCARASGGRAPRRGRRPR